MGLLWLECLNDILIKHQRTTIFVLIIFDETFWDYGYIAYTCKHGHCQTAAHSMNKLGPFEAERRLSIVMNFVNTGTYTESNYFRFKHTFQMI